MSYRWRTLVPVLGGNIRSHGDSDTVAGRIRKRPQKKFLLTKIQSWIQPDPEPLLLSKLGKLRVSYQL